jgi:uncharacterized protein YoxC
MSTDEFELHYRETMRDVLDQLQYIVMMSSQLQDAITKIGTSVQTLNQTTEQFLNQQRGRVEPSSLSSR